MVFRYFGPRYPINQLRDEVDRLLTGFFGNVAPGSAAGPTQPAVNVWEDDEQLFVELEVPGLKSEQLEIAVVDNELSIKIDRPEVEQEGVMYHRRERPVGTFNRVLRLPAEVDADRVSAELQHGVLTITLLKAESARPKKIKVTTAGGG
jgi:HSP20 family protein